MTLEVSSSRLRLGVLFVWVLVSALVGCAPPRSPGPGPVSPDGPIVVGKGAGQAEFALLFVHANQQDLFKQCQALCGLTAGEETLLQKIELQSQDPELFKPVFKSKKELGTGVFKRQGREVWLNQDELWLDSGKTVALDLPSAMALWLDILSEPLSSMRHDEALSALKSKMKDLMKTETRYAELKLGDEQVVNSLLWRQSRLQTAANDRLILWDLQSRFLDLTEKAREATAGSRLQFFAMNWGSPVGQEPKEIRQLNLEVAASWLDASQKPVRGQIDFVIPVEKNGGKFVINPGLITAIATEE